MKRIPKGWVFRAYPRPFEAIIEGPDYDVSVEAPNLHFIFF